MSSFLNAYCINAMVECYFSLSGVLNLLDRTRIEIEDESEVKIDNANDEYLVINDQVNQMIPEALYFRLSLNKASTTPSSI